MPIIKIIIISKNYYYFYYGHMYLVFYIFWDHRTVNSTIVDQGTVKKKLGLRPSQRSIETFPPLAKIIIFKIFIIFFIRFFFLLNLDENIGLLACFSTMSYEICHQRVRLTMEDDAVISKSFYIDYIFFYSHFPTTVSR